MNCTEFDEALRRMVEDRRPIRVTDLQAHAADCDQCRELWSSAWTLDQAIERWRTDVPAVDLAARILEAAVAERRAPLVTLGSNRPTVRPPTARRNQIVVLSLSVAVMLLAVVAAGWRSSSQPADAIRVAQLESVNTEAAIPVDDMSSEDVGQLVRDVQESWRALASESVAVAEGLTRPMETNDPASPGLILPDWPEPRLDHWAEGWKPIGHEMGKALGFLRMAVPETSPAG